MPKKSIMQTRVEAAREAEYEKLAELRSRRDNLYAATLLLEQQIEDLDREAATINQTIALLDGLLAAPEEDEPEEAEP